MICDLTGMISNYDKKIKVETLRYPEISVRVWVVYRARCSISIPVVNKCPNGTVAGGLEALLILLRRLTY